ncbi:unnamed protein product [Ectocarpus sp. 12 AP-2014]
MCCRHRAVCRRALTQKGICCHRRCWSTWATSHAMVPTWAIDTIPPSFGREHWAGPLLPRGSECYSFALAIPLSHLRVHFEVSANATGIKECGEERLYRCAYGKSLVGWSPGLRSPRTTPTRRTFLLCVDMETTAFLAARKKDRTAACSSSARWC